MYNRQTHEQDQSRTRNQVNQFETQSGHSGGEELNATPEIAIPYRSSLLHDRRLNMSDNAPTRASVMQRAQQTHGNRAVQRAIQPYTGASTASHLPVQRMFPGIGGNSNPMDWMKTPSPVGPVPIPYPNMSEGGGGGGMFGGMLGGGGGGLAGMRNPMGMLGGLGGMLGGGLGGVMGGLGGMLSGGGGTATRMAGLAGSIAGYIGHTEMEKTTGELDWLEGQVENLGGASGTLMSEMERLRHY